MPKLPINVSEPQVKDIANFCGLIAIMGNPTKNASAKNNADRNSKAQKTWNRRMRTAVENCDRVVMSVRDRIRTWTHVIENVRVIHPKSYLESLLVAHSKNLFGHLSLHCLPHAVDAKTRQSICISLQTLSAKHRQYFICIEPAWIGRTTAFSGPLVFVPLPKRWHN